MIEKLVAFIQWVSAPEKLPSKVTGAESLGARIENPRFFRWLFHADALEHAGLTPKRAPKPRGVLRNIFTTETLPQAGLGQFAAPAQLPRTWRWILSGEVLPVAKTVDHDQTSRTMFLTRLLEVEACPRHVGVAIEHREGFFRQLLAQEQCPSRPTSPARRGFTRWLLEQEECPVESSSAPVRRQGFLGKLFASEKL